MRTHFRPAALAVGAVPLAAALLVTGCDASSTATASVPGEAFSRAGFTLGPRGGIELSGASREAVTPAGSYPVTAGRAHGFARPDDKLLVVLRHWPQERAARGAAHRLPPLEEPAVETGFLVDTANWTLAELDGHPLQWLRRATIRVDTTNGTVGDLTRLTLSGPHGGRSGQPVEPPDDRACAGLDPLVNRRVTLPDIEPGTPVTDALTRLRGQCLNVQYASRPDSGRPGTVHSVVVPVAGQSAPAAVVPGLGAGDVVLAEPSRPATVVVAR
ncbi:hypothetical protein [Streptomyces sp. GESEQ-35]|uniref:hypothetical protein n=1 Tax=Streptomyces sp. GESEQ-35 TaxID=2812657 RepID=UPI001B322220|nr:hypothetical protein [Streptomyces sp. GESEQ-35]